MTPVHVRWLIRRDYPTVLAIEAATCPLPWSEEEFLAQLRKRDTIGMIAESCDGTERILGFFVCRMNKDNLHLLKLATHAEAIRQGVGGQMIAKLKKKLSPHRRTRIGVNVRESSLAAQLFFKAHGFRAHAVQRDFCGTATGTEDAYTMVYDLLEIAHLAQMARLGAATVDTLTDRTFSEWSAS